MKYYVAALRRYAVFRGRATRPEYWVAVLVHLFVLGALVSLAERNQTLAPLFSIYFLGTAVPFTALAARRLHDAGFTGWLQLLGLVPLGALAVIVLLVLPGVHGPNRYGPDPRDALVQPAGPDPWADDPGGTTR